MNTRIYIIGLVAVAALMSACEKRIDIDIEDQQQKVVVKSDNCIGEDVSIALTLSRPVYGSFYVRNGEDYFSKVTDATATLSVDGTQLSATREGNIYTFAHQPQPGDELTLKVEVPGHEAVSATATVPYPPTVENVVLDTSARGFYGSTLHFTLADNGSSGDYYAVRVHLLDTAIWTEYTETDSVLSCDTNVTDEYVMFLCTDYLIVDNTSLETMMEPDDPEAAVTVYTDELLFTDANINGQRHKLTININSPYGYYDESRKDYDIEDLDHNVVNRHRIASLEVLSVSRDVYLYRQTLDAYDDDEILNFFSEPVQIHSNINGGIGVFGVNAVFEKEIYNTRSTELNQPYYPTYDRKKQ